jgi:hypothetical protein
MGVENSKKSAFFRGCDKDLAVLAQLHHSQTAAMTLDLDGLFLAVEVNDLDVACLFIGDRQNTDSFLHRQTDEAEWILAGDKAVGQVEVLEVVDVDLVLQYNHNSATKSD